MIADRALFENGIKAEDIVTLINRHSAGNERRRKLYDYYIGRHNAILDRKTRLGTPNNKTVNNYCKYIVDMCSGFFFGAPLGYKTTTNYDITALTECYDKQGINNIDIKLFKTDSIFGNAYELVYANAKSDPASVSLSPFDTFVVYDDTAEHEPIFGVYYRTKQDLKGTVTGYTVDVYTDTEIIHFQSVGTNYLRLEETGRDDHYFEGVPLIEYLNNDELQGDFEQIIYNVDAYNKLQSDRVNDKEQFVDAFLFLRSIEIDSDKAQKLKIEKILMGFDEYAEAKYLSKVLNESDTEVLKKSLNDDIHKFSMVPDLSDEKFGGNLSGVALEYKLIAFENLITNKEAFFFAGLRKRAKLYINFLAKQNRIQPMDVHDIDIIASRNLPQDDEKKADMVNKLRGIVSDTTLRGELSFITDEAGELLRLREQESVEELKAERETERLLSGKGYKKDFEE